VFVDLISETIKKYPGEKSLPARKPKRVPSLNLKQSVFSSDLSKPSANKF
jgi:hypothetical protein